MPRWKNLTTTIVLCILVTYTLFVTGTTIFHSLQRRERPILCLASSKIFRVERGVGGQYFGRRKTQLCTLPISNPLWSAVNSSHKNIQMKIQGPALTTVQCCGAEIFLSAAPRSRKSEFRLRLQLRLQPGLQIVL
jgi:hypothetical protein